MCFDVVFVKKWLFSNPVTNSLFSYFVNIRLATKVDAKTNAVLITHTNTWSISIRLYSTKYQKTGTANVMPRI